MGKCIYCGEKAGFFKSIHKECEKAFNQGKIQYINEIKSTIVSGNGFNSLESKLDNIRKNNYVKTNHHNLLLTKAFDSAVESFLDDGILSTEEEDKIKEFQNHFNLKQEDLNKNGSFLKIAKSSILRDITEGHTPKLVLNIEEQLPFLFQKSETLIWVFYNVKFYEQTTETQYRGGSQGASIKVAKGLYFRTSSFKAKPVRKTEMRHISTGIVALTTKHFYFGSHDKKFKTSFKKLISVEPFQDGVGLQKDGVRAKPQVFQNLDGWFTYNAISNLIQQ